MPNLWESDFGRRTRQVNDLLPVQVVLRDDQWLTIAMRSPMGVALEDPISRVGKDVGGTIHLKHEIHDEIADGDIITSYVVGRRGIKAMDRMKLMASEDDFRRKPKNLDGIKYDIVISFKTDAEAVAFALMFSQ